MDEDLAATAANYFADACERSGHVLGSRNGENCRCRALARRLASERQARLNAETFDVSRIHFSCAPNVTTLPNGEWHPAALFHSVAKDVVSHPWLDQSELQRKIRLTLALTRIGELGVPPDVIVRVGFRRRIKAAIKVRVMSELSAGSAIGSVPLELGVWLDLVAETVDSAVIESDDDSRLLSMFHAFEHGAFAQRMDNWMDSAPIESIFSWLYTEEKAHDLREEDINIRGGHEAVYWLVDRFTHTHYRDWYRTSLYWELRFAANPELTATEAGLPLSLLSRRPSHTGLLVESIVARASYALDHESLIGDVSNQELLSYVFELLRSGAIDQAIGVLRSILDKYPTLWAVRSLLGFCLIPKDPRVALEQIDKCAREVGGGTALLLANRAAAFMRLNQFDRAQNVLRNVRKLEDAETYILWNPADLRDKVGYSSHRIGWYRLRDWVDEASVLTVRPT